MSTHKKLGFGDLPAYCKLNFSTLEANDHIYINNIKGFLARFSNP